MARSNRRNDPEETGGKHDKEPKIIFPKLIRKSGPYQQAIEAALKLNNPRACDLAKSFSRILVSLRKSVRTECRGKTCSPDEVRQRTLKVLAKKEPDGGDGCYSFFCSYLIWQLGEKIGDEQADRGLRWLGLNHDVVDLVLGNLVDEQIRACAATDAYRKNLNNTAAHDWWAFRHNHSKASGGLSGVPTGFAELDQLIHGLAGVNILAGPTSSGKSSLATKLAIGVLDGTTGCSVLC